MLDQIRTFLSGLRDSNQDEPDPRNPDVAAVALFFHVIGADGVVDEVESEKLRSLIAQEYDLDAAGMRRLIEAGRQADREAVDLYQFTSVLNRSLEPDRKVHFIELLWNLAYADGYRHELEDHVVWRIADLMGVSSRDRVLARQRALSAAGIEEGGRTGLTAVTVGVLMLTGLFFAGLFKAIPTFAVAPALIVVGAAPTQRQAE